MALWIAGWEPRAPAGVETARFLPTGGQRYGRCLASQEFE
jgi:hypothetical protein